MRIVPVLVGLVASNHALAACGATTSPDQLVAQLDAVEDAFSNVEVDGFIEGVDEIGILLPCMDSAVDPAVAARLHRIYGIRFFLDDRADLAANAFTAAKGLDPAYSFPATLVPEGHPIGGMYAQLPVTEPITETLPPPAGSLYFDGTKSHERPRDRATVIQVFDADDKPVDGRYLSVDAAVPFYLKATGRDAAMKAAGTDSEPDESAATVEPEPVELPDVGPSEKRPTGRLVAGLGIGVVGVGSMGVAAMLKGKYSSTPLDEDASGLKTANLVAGGAGIALGVTGAGLATSALLSGRW